MQEKQTVGPLTEARTKPVFLRVLLADDQVLFTEALSEVIVDHGIELVSVHSFGALLAELGERDREFDLVIVDLSCSAQQAIVCLRDVRSRHPDVRVAILTSDAQTEFIGEAIGYGAIGVIARTSRLISIATAIRFMADGEQFVPASFMDASTHATADPSELSEQEVEILREMANGISNRKIACRLGLEEAAIKGKTKAIYRKLGVHNRTKAAVVARSRGYI